MRSFFSFFFTTLYFLVDSGHGGEDLVVLQRVYSKGAKGDRGIVLLLVELRVEGGGGL